MFDPIVICTFLQIRKCLQLYCAAHVCTHAAIVPPVNINMLLVVCVVHLPIDRTLRPPLPTTRQQLVEAETGPSILACTSTASQLNLAGWA